MSALGNARRSASMPSAPSGGAPQSTAARIMAMLRQRSQEAADARVAMEQARMRDAETAARAAEALAQPVPPRRTPSTASPLEEELQVVQTSAAPGLDVNPVTGRPRGSALILPAPGVAGPPSALVVQTDPIMGTVALNRSASGIDAVPTERLARQVVDASGNTVLAETDIEPTQLVRRRTGGDGNRSVAERMWVTPTGEGRFQVSTDGGTTLGTTVTEEAVRDMVSAGGWERYSGPALDIEQSLPSPLATGRALLEYARDPGDVRNLAGVLADLDVLQKSGDGSLYREAIGIAGGGAPNDITPQNLEAGQRLVGQVRETVGVSEYSPASSGRVGTGQADVPFVAPGESPADIAAIRRIVAARSPMGVRLPTNENSTQIQIGGGPAAPVGQRPETVVPGSAPGAAAVSELAAPQPYGVTVDSVSTGLTPNAARQIIGAETFGDTAAGPGPVAPPPAPAAEQFVASFAQEQPGGPLDLELDIQDSVSPARATTEPDVTLRGGNASVLDDLLVGVGPSASGDMALQVNPGSWASSVLGGRRDDLADLINRSLGLESYSFSTADSPTLSASDLVGQMTPEARARFGRYGLPSTGTVLPVPLSGESAARAAATSSATTADAGSVSLPRIATDTDVLASLRRPRAVPGERFITNRPEGPSPQQFDDASEELQKLIQLRRDMEARARFESRVAEDSALGAPRQDNAGAAAIANRESDPARGALNEIARLQQQADAIRSAAVRSRSQGMASMGGQMGAAATRAAEMTLPPDALSELGYIDDEISKLRDQVASTRPETFAAQDAAADDAASRSALASEYAAAAERVQDRIRSLQSRIGGGVDYGLVNRRALSEAASADEAARAADAAVDMRDANLIREADAASGQTGVGQLSSERLRQIAREVLYPDSNDGPLPAAFGAYDSRPPDGRPSRDFVEDIRAREQAIEDMMPKGEDAALLTDAQVRDITRRQAELRRQLEQDVARSSGDPYGGQLVEGEVRSRTPAGKAQARMVERLLSDSPEERMAALNDLFGRKVRGEIEIYKDPATGEIWSVGEGQDADAGQLLIRDMSDSERAWSPRLNRYIGTGEWRPFDPARDGGRIDEARHERFNPMTVKVRQTSGGLEVLDRLAAHPEIGSRENLLYNILRSNRSLTESMSDDGIRDAARQLADEAARAAPKSPSGPVAKVGEPSVVQRIQGLLTDINSRFSRALQPTDFVSESLPADRLVAMLPQSSDISSADHAAARRALSQVRYVEDLAAKLEADGNDVSAVRQAIDAVMPAIDEAHRPLPREFTARESKPSDEIGASYEELQEQASVLRRSIQQANAAGDTASAERLGLILQRRNNQMAELRPGGSPGGAGTRSRGVNERLAPVLHTSERPGDFMPKRAFSMREDVAEQLREALSGNLLNDAAANKALGGPQIKVEEAEPRFDGQQAYPQARITVRRRYSGGAAPERSFLVDVVEPGVVYPDAVTLELDRRNKPLFFVNKEGSLEMPPSTIDSSAQQDARSAAAIMSAGEDDAMRLTSRTVSSGGGGVPGEAAAAEVGGRVRAARIARRRQAAERRRPQGQAEQDPDFTLIEEESPAVQGRSEPEPEKPAEPAAEGKTWKRVKRGARLAAVGAAAAGGAWALKDPLMPILSGNPAMAAGPEFESGGAALAQEDTNTEEDILSRIRNARRYSYHTFQNPMPR